MKMQGAMSRPSSVTKHRAMLAAAEEAFLAARYDAVTVDEIAEMSGVAKQTVYAHFGSKDRLFVELVTMMTRAAGDEVATEWALPSEPALLEPALEHLLGHQLAAVLSPRLVRLRRLVISEVPRFPELARAVYDEGPRRGVATIEGALRQCSARGWLELPDVPAAAEQLNWMVMGGPTNAVMFLGEGATPTVDAQHAHVRFAVATFLAAHGRGC